MSMSRRLFLSLLLVLMPQVGLMGCTGNNLGTATQAVAGPSGVTVTVPTVGGVPVAGQLAVSWSADPAGPVKYYVYQSANGGAFALVASVIDPSQAPPAPTSFNAVQLIGGVPYCYAVQSAYPDGTTSDIGDAGCGVAVGTEPPQVSRSITFWPGLATFNIPGGFDTGPNREGPFFNNFRQAAGGSTAGQIDYPIILPTGNRLRSWSLLVSKTSAPPATLTAKLFRVLHDIATQIGHTQTISTAPGSTNIGESGLSEDIVPGFYYVEVSSPDSGVGNGTDQTQELTVTYDAITP